jgi:predicted alpha/beta hydrolase family esterase
VSHIVIAHGLGVSPRDHWFAGVARALETYGHVVVIPQLPRPDHPVAADWVASLVEATAGVEPDDTVLVAHGLGGDAVLRLLERHDTRRRGRFAGVGLVASPAFAVGGASWQPFFEPPFDWSRIRATAARFWLLDSADDPVTAPDPFAHVKVLVTELQAEALVKPSGGQLPTTGSELRALPEVIEFVLSCLNSRVPA